MVLSDPKIDCATGFFQWRTSGANGLRHCWVRPIVKLSGARARHCSCATGAAAAHSIFNYMGEPSAAENAAVQQFNGGRSNG